MKNTRRILILLAILVAIAPVSWVYTSIQLATARSKGEFASPEQGMLAMADQYYAPDKSVKILYAGTNSFDGSDPHIWYVIAEIRASARADGSEMGRNGCDAPGSFFLQLNNGNWVHVPEGAFPGFMGFWMKVFDMAGEGLPNSSTSWSPNQAPDFCQ